jgi:Skp family chaperone for outer membrane proteins
VFKKLITLMLVLSIFTVQAHASTNEGLKAAFNELNYALTTEWDQKDNAVYEAEMKKFSAVVRDLQAKGLTNAQLLDFAKSEIKDAKAAKDLETAMTMVQINKMSSSEASKYVLDTMKKSYSTGASWNGEVFVYLAVGVLIVALAVALASSNVTYSSGNSCYYQDVYVCDQYCYYDGWGYYTCYDDCYYTTQYTCY